MGRRSLRNMCLRYLMAASDSSTGGLARAQFDAADQHDRHDRALACLVNVEGSDRADALARFYARFECEALVVDKWFSVQASSHRATTLDEVVTLMSHPAFNLQNPNRARALIDSFASGNPYRFHAAEWSRLRRSCASRSHASTASTVRWRRGWWPRSRASPASSPPAGC